ncbi:MAG: hypothetical protein ABIC19_00660 [Patescibacteria group bacterium]
MTKKTTQKLKKMKETVSPEDQIVYLEDLQSSHGWQIITRICEGNIEYLDKMIIKKKDSETGEELTDKEVDRLRDKRGYLVELMETPKNFIEKLTQSNIPPEEFDPYYKDAKDIVEARKKQNFKT